ncbi:MAG: hypothetical protein Kow0099_21750 [Candidatus Abyssubacteria bacterium]
MGLSGGLNYKRVADIEAEQSQHLDLSLLGTGARGYGGLQQAEQENCENDCEKEAACFVSREAAHCLSVLLSLDSQVVCSSTFSKADQVGRDVGDERTVIE